VKTATWPFVSETNGGVVDLQQPPPVGSSSQPGARKSTDRTWYTWPEIGGLNVHGTALPGQPLPLHCESSWPLSVQPPPALRSETHISSGRASLMQL
jgi:hypothetical protein